MRFRTFNRDTDVHYSNIDHMVHINKYMYEYGKI